MKPRLTLPRDDNHTGRDLGEEEIALLTQAIKSGCLTSTRGTMVKALEESFARKHDMKHCVAASSGTAAMHTAVAAIDPEPGDEIVTTPITDMGALTPILYQGAIPVFADVDPDTCNVTAETIAPRITRRTRAIIVTHLFGNPCDMDPILALAARHGIPVIEDCAQAFLAEYRRPAASARSAPSAASACSRASTSRPARAASSSPTTPSSAAACACSSTRPGATATRTRITTSSRSTTG